MAHPFDEFADLGFSQWAGLGVKLGGRPAVNRLLKDETRVMFSDETTAVVQGKLLPLFDSNARLIPPMGLQNAQRDANRQFHLVQPQIKHVDRVKLLQDVFGRGVEFPSPTEFADRCGAVREMLAGNSQTANLLKGVCLDLAFPRLQSNDLGDLVQQAVTAAGKSYESQSQFRGRRFVNHRENDLRGKVSVVVGVRHEIFIVRLAGFSAGPRIGVFFPNALQGYSPLAQREALASLPEYFLLSGVDTPFAIATYPDILARDYNTPGLDMSALQWRGASLSLYFRASGLRLDFDGRSSLGRPRDGYSGGLLVLG